MISKITKEQEIVVFHYRIGVAITQWADVEHQLRDLMNVCFEAKHLNRESLSIGLFSLEGFRAKLAFVNGVVSRKLAGSQFAKEWQALMKRARKHSSLRNNLAHWPMGKYWHRKQGRRLCLTPWVFRKPSRKSSKPVPPAGSIYAVDICEYGMKFYALAVSLGNFRARICGQTEPYEKVRERADRAPPFEKLVNETHVAFAPVPLSAKEKRRLGSEANAEASKLVPVVTDPTQDSGNQPKATNV